MPSSRVAPTVEEAARRFIYIEDDGSARELSPDECEYLTMAFEPMDGGRPYVKSSYDSRTPDGRLRGFLERKKIPRHIVVPVRAR